MIPEHTDRAARIKQSRVKMMRLKAKIGRGGRRIEDTGRERERGRERKKSIKGLSEAEDENIEESEENFSAFTKNFDTSRLRITRICRSLPMDPTRRGEKTVRLLYPLPTPLAGMMSEKLEA